MSLLKRWMLFSGKVSKLSAMHLRELNALLRETEDLGEDDDDESERQHLRRRGNPTGYLSVSSRGPFENAANPSS